MATCSINTTTEGASFNPPTEQAALYGVATNLLDSANILASSCEIRREGLILLLGHITECLLKSIITYANGQRNLLRRRHFRHNLVTLWELAANNTSELQLEAPSWVVYLNAFHDEPYVSRYMKDITFYSLPPTEPMLSEVRKLHQVARNLLEIK